MSILRAAGLIAILSLLSKGMGLLRDMVVAYYCGLSAVADAYNVAYLIPGSFALLMIGGLNGPFHSAVVSSLTQAYREKDNQTWRVVLSTVVLTTLLAMGGAALALGWFAPQVIQFFFPSLPTLTADLAVLQLRIMAPIFALSGLIGISYGVLSIRQQFLTPSLSPIMASLAIIVALFCSPWIPMPEGLMGQLHVESLMTTPFLQGLSAAPVTGLLWSGARTFYLLDLYRLSLALAWGTTLGAVFQLLLQMLPLMRSFRLLPIYFRASDPQFLSLMGLLIPAFMSSTVGQVNLFVINFFAGSLAEGSISAFQLGNRLLQLPLGILLTALLVPMLPVLSTAALEKDNHRALITRLNQGLRPILLITLPVTVLMICFGPFMISLLFERGEFGLRDTLMTYQVVLFLSISITLYAVRDLLVRVFYALKNSRIPFYTTFVSIAAMFVFSWLLAKPMGVGGIALATSLATLLNFLTLSGLLRRTIGPWIEPQTWAHLARVLVACLPLVGLGSLTLYNLLGQADRWQQMLGALYSGTLLCILYALILIALRDPEVHLLSPVAGRVYNKFKRLLPGHRNK